MDYKRHWRKGGGQFGDPVEQSKGIVTWSAFKKFDCKQKLQEYHLTYIILYYNK